MAKEFCPHCSQQIDSDANFCPLCGKQILRPGAAPPPAPGGASAVQEPIILAFAVQLKKGLLGSKPYIFVATPLRFIFAVYDNGRYREFMKQQTMESKARGDGFLARMGNAMLSGFAFVDRYRGMHPNDILAEDKENFVIPLNEVEWLKYDDVDRRRDDDGSVSSEAARMFIRARGQEWKMTIGTLGNRDRENENIFRQLLGDRYKRKIFG